jgi:hypothetical protein
VVLKPFLIVYLPFPDAELTSERVEYGKDEEDAQKKFETRYPGWRVKEIRPR